MTTCGLSEKAPFMIWKVYYMKIQINLSFVNIAHVHNTISQLSTRNFCTCHFMINCKEHKGYKDWKE